ncbi:hypothetical protein LM600727_120102 [Listeria monocytogenes]|nr:hypothetical protein LM600727_120102 [Listeria monocytogenes]CUL07235.1 hypothetical protein LM701345_140102 [Listeria monocytogenes]CUL08822.1 hypothetical protein LM701145_210102 [Listeria monocytogenes]CUL15140.1 hypothetical protein LM701377_270105 [Listeria monocytogenes]CUL26961.1 hypothetical protein LM7414_240115 [Listeria monocytogenes]
MVDIDFGWLHGYDATSKNYLYSEIPGVDLNAGRTRAVCNVYTSGDMEFATCL